jgi:hypothetical protein
MRSLPPQAVASIPHDLHAVGVDTVRERSVYYVPDDATAAG